MSPDIFLTLAPRDHIGVDQQYDSGFKFGVEQLVNNMEFGMRGAHFSSNQIEL